jgi:hypothetical protein
MGFMIDSLIFCRDQRGALGYSSQTAGESARALRAAWGPMQHVTRYKFASDRPVAGLLDLFARDDSLSSAMAKHK